MLSLASPRKHAQFRFPLLHPELSAMSTPRAGSRAGTGPTEATPATPAPVWLNTVKAANHLCYSPWTLRDWRKKNLGPPYEKAPGPHGAVRYDRHALDAWMIRNPRVEPVDAANA